MLNQIQIIRWTNRLQEENNEKDTHVNLSIKLSNYQTFTFINTSNFKYKSVNDQHHNLEQW